MDVGPCLVNSPPPSFNKHSNSPFDVHFQELQLSLWPTLAHSLTRPFDDFRSQSLILIHPLALALALARKHKRLNKSFTGLQSCRSPATIGVSRSCHPPPVYQAACLLNLVILPPRI